MCIGTDHSWRLGADVHNFGSIIAATEPNPGIRFENSFLNEKLVL
jgi:hypothetical protein